MCVCMHTYILVCVCVCDASQLLTVSSSDHTVAFLSSHSQSILSHLELRS